MTAPPVDAKGALKPAGPHWPSLDGMRGVFMVAIFVYHVDPYLLPGAAISVDSFFVLSGFLITYLLIRERNKYGQVSLRLFYARRALRLLPALFVAVPIIAAVTWKVLPGDRHLLPEAATSSLLYYANWWRAYHPKGLSTFGPYWSLSAEEQFYLVWPSLLLLFYFLFRGRMRIVAMATAGLVVVAAAWHQIAAERGANAAVLIYRPDMHIDGILIGCTLGVVFAYGWLPRGPWVSRLLPVATVASVAYIVFYMRWSPQVPSRYVHTLAITAAGLAFAIVIWQQVEAPLRPLSWLLANPVSRWIGRASYSLYLVHIAVIKNTNELMSYPSVPVRYLVITPLTLLVAGALHYAVERPALRMKDRLEPWIRREPARPAAPVGATES